ncbi:MAG: hypothetical protein ACYDHY_18900 [Acidiferrobacterales bacterium]
MKDKTIQLGDGTIATLTQKDLDARHGTVDRLRRTRSSKQGKQLNLTKEEEALLRALADDLENEESQREGDIIEALAKDTNFTGIQ